MLERLRRHADLLITLGLMGTSFTLYAITAAPSVLTADAGEFQFVPYIAGITHPTGYPLYTMLGWLWTHVFTPGDVAYRMNLFSALWGAVTIGLMYQVAFWGLKLGAPVRIRRLHRILSALVASLFMASGTFWSQAVIAEVYTLNTAFVAGILYVALRLWDAASPGAESRPDVTRWLMALSFICGLSLAHHRTTILLLPWLGLFVWFVTRKASRPQGRKWPLVLAGLLLPQLLYLYIPWRAPHVPYVELSLDSTRTLVLYENNLRGFMDLVLGGAFGGQLAQGPIGTARLEMAVTLLHDEFTWLGLSLGLIGILAIIRRRAWPLLMLTLLPYLSYVGFNLLYFIGDVYVLFIPSYLIWAVWIGWGVWEVVATLLSLLESSLSSPARERLAEGLIVVSFSLPVLLLARNYAVADQSQNWSVVSFWQAILRSEPPPRSILISNDRDEIMPMWYYQYVDGRRPDLLGLFPLIVRQPGYGDVVEVIASALASQRPTFLIKPMPGLELKYEFKAREPLVQVLGSHEGRRPDHPLDISLDGMISLVGYDVSQEPADTLRVTLFWKPTRKMDRRLSSFVHVQDAAGQNVAGHDHQPGGDYYPTDAWKPGEVLLDTHVIPLPAGLAGGQYRLTAGLYVWPTMERLGAEQELGTVHIN